MSHFQLPAVTNQHRWFGVYSPDRAQQASKGLAPSIEAQLREPMTSHSQLASLLRDLSEALPSFGPIRDLFQAGSLAYVPTSSNVFKPRSVRGCKHLHIPANRPFANYFHSFLVTVGEELPPPQGLEFIEDVPRGTRPSILNSLQNLYAWRIALMESFRFQMSIELIAAGLEVFSHVSNTALFPMFRKRGLMSLAKNYLWSLQRGEFPQKEIFIDILTDQIIRGEGLTSPDQPWVDPPLGSRPELPRTYLDEIADASAGFSRGLYREVPSSTALEASVAQDIRKHLEGEVSTPGELRRLLKILEILAPTLAKEILKPIYEGKIEIAITETPLPRAVSAAVSSRRLAGIPYTLQAQIFVNDKASNKEVLSGLVHWLAYAQAPDDLIHPPRHSISLKQLPTLEKEIERAHIRMDVWGKSALFAFVSEARQRGYPTDTLDIVQDTSFEEMQRILLEDGLDILCERWACFKTQEDLTPLRRYFKSLAQQVLSTPAQA